MERMKQFDIIPVVFGLSIVTVIELSPLSVHQRDAHGVHQVCDMESCISHSEMLTVTVRKISLTLELVCH